MSREPIEVSFELLEHGVLCMYAADFWIGLRLRKHNRSVL